MKLEIEIDSPKSEYISFVETVELPGRRVITSDAHIGEDQAITFRVTESDPMSSAGSEVASFVIRMFNEKLEVSVYLKDNHEEEPNFHWREGE